MRNESTRPRQETSGKHQTKAEESWERPGRLLWDGQRPSEGGGARRSRLEKKKTHVGSGNTVSFPFWVAEQTCEETGSPFSPTTTKVVMKKVFGSGWRREGGGGTTGGSARASSLETAL